VRTFTVGVPGGSLFVYAWGDADCQPLLYWDGLGGSGRHANEIAPVLAEEYGLRVLAPDPPGHGRSGRWPATTYRPSGLAELAAELLSALDVERAAFLGFSWGGRVGCSFAALYSERCSSLALVEGGHYRAPPPAGDDAADLAACVAEARSEREEETFPSWEAYFDYERASLRRWSPALEEAHRGVMREEDGGVAPILQVEALGAIKHGNRVEPVTETYAAIRAAGVPVLLVVAARPTGSDVDAAVARFRAALPLARIESIPDAIHDLVSFAPRQLAELVGGFVSGPADAAGPMTPRPRGVAGRAQPPP